MSALPDPRDVPALVVLPPDEALRHARPVPAEDELATTGVTDEEWSAFERALADT
jgi:hypothetical protein